MVRHHHGHKAAKSASSFDYHIIQMLHHYKEEIMLFVQSFCNLSKIYYYLITINYHCIHFIYIYLTLLDAQ